MVIVDEDSITPLEAACSQQVSFSVDVWNIGNRDFDDQIMVTLFNSELGIEMREIALGDLDEGDRTDVSFLFTVPSDANEKIYSLIMQTFYDYDENDGKYQNDYDRKSDDTFKITRRVTGNCGTVGTEAPLVSASLDSEAKAGESLVVIATITNPGEGTATYLINAAGFAGWASSVNLDKGSFTLGPGESELVVFTFEVKSDASGEKLFSIELVSEGQFVSSQSVSVLIEKSSGFGFTGAAIRGNATAFALGLLNVILILVIIFVAIRVARR